MDDSKELFGIEKYNFSRKKALEEKIRRDENIVTFAIAGHNISNIATAFYLTRMQVYNICNRDDRFKKMIDKKRKLNENLKEIAESGGLSTYIKRREYSIETGIEMIKLRMFNKKYYAHKGTDGESAESGAE